MGQSVNDGRNFIRIIDSDLLKHIAKLPHPKERRNVLQNLSKKSEVMGLHFTRSLRLIQNLK